MRQQEIQRQQERRMRQESRIQMAGHGTRRQKQKRQKRALHRKIFGFCLFTFLLGVMFGKIVFAGEAEAAGVVGNLTSPGSFLTAARDKEREGEDWKLTLVNASHPVEEGYEPELAEIENNYYFDARAVEFLQEMLAAGRKEGLDFWVCSAYRTIEKQTELYEDKVRRIQAEGTSGPGAREEAARTVARPGTSEHNLGLAVDIVARDYQILDEKQEQTDEQQWLMENCWKYGFILRYPTDKTEITGIIYEPWHYRYVGREAAREIMEQGICLEEYLGYE